MTTEERKQIYLCFRMEPNISLCTFLSLMLARKSICKLQVGELTLGFLSDR